MSDADVTRRAFLKTGAAALGAALMPPESSGGALLERRIPRTGEALPAVGLGTWLVFDVAGDAGQMAQAKDTLKAFVDLGGRVVDSSPMYGSSESVTGQLMSELGTRAKLFVATKVWRDLFPSPEEVYTQGLRFMKEKWAAAAR